MDLAKKTEGGAGAPGLESIYDRQIRIWGEAGQQALEKARVCVLNGSATGAECLKNLVLPGIGGFTLVDGSRCTQRDLGNNFFVRQDALGMSRAETVASTLTEMNGAVKGRYEDVDVSDILQSRDPLQFFAQFTLVIATQIPYGETLKRIAEACWRANVPLMVVRCYGLIGFLRLVVPEMCVTHSREEELTPDIRLTAPFQGLTDVVDQFDLDSGPDDHHGHIPYLIILIKALQTWRKADPLHRANRVPQTTDEKRQIKQIIKAWKRKPDQENFEQAEKNARFLWTGNHGKPNPALHNVLNNPKASPKADELQKDPNRRFWLLVAALRLFVQNEGQGRLPVRATLPDMASDTANYVKLQQAFAAKADQDSASVLAHAQRIAVDLGVGNELVDEESVREFCKNCHSVKVMKFRTIAEELEASSKVTVDLDSEGPERDFHFYTLLRAADRFQVQHARFPGQPVSSKSKASIEEDLVQFQACLSTVVSEMGLAPGCVPGDYAAEMCRFGGAELHNVSSLMGGIVAQEAVKVLSAQFVPVESAFLYNGISSTSISFGV